MNSQNSFFYVKIGLWILTPNFTNANFSYFNALTILSITSGVGIGIIDLIVLGNPSISKSSGLFSTPLNPVQIHVLSKLILALQDQIEFGLISHHSHSKQ